MNIEDNSYLMLIEKYNHYNTEIYPFYIHAQKNCQIFQSDSFYNFNYLPISSLTSLKHLTMKSISSFVWLAHTCVRILALPFGTTG